MEEKNNIMKEGAFRIEDKRPMRDGMTISRDAGLESENGVTWFSLGKGTSISMERYDTDVIYLGAAGICDFSVGDVNHIRSVHEGEILSVTGGTLCGSASTDGAVYTEMMWKNKKHTNEMIKDGEVIKLKDLISYEPGSIANLDIASNETMKFVLMAFDEGTVLCAHRATGNALVYALEGNAVIEYEGIEYPIAAGESFYFKKDGLHSVRADGKFKMALLLAL